MKRVLETLVVAMALLASVPVAASAQNAGTPNQIEQRDPDHCGVAGAGCDPADVKQWKAVGNRLADLSSADLSQYAYACARHPEWKKDCQTDPAIILKRLGIEGY
ncbi:hypothetical protein B5K05_33615 [Rhizobium phaseoli]|uniref:hypothetical protein n=1 Tax=Rhizobium phaseoli TaxID=396 RepID=UPI000E0D31D9|nr:hypothetical protein [Rhizobium phaseoli]RDJ00807.1 hypothetical protein B5K05_33615 [Rhizobium phaseoli]RDJ00883.1 hypothetical protein B5K04_30925 [Rhizobium phaseoli]